MEKSRREARQASERAATKFLPSPAHYLYAPPRPAALWAVTAVTLLAARGCAAALVYGGSDAVFWGMCGGVPLFSVAAAQASATFGRSPGSATAAVVLYLVLCVLLGVGGALMGGSSLAFGVGFLYSVAAALVNADWSRKLNAAFRSTVPRCRKCGYDLRATPDRCPECGYVPSEAVAGAKPHV